MTNAQPSESPRVYLPGVAILLFIAAPILLITGVWITATRPDYDGAWLIWTGVAALMCALILEGVRSVAQQQVDILRAERLTE